jgi:AraC family transcriptional regulator
MFFPESVWTSKRALQVKTLSGIFNIIKVKEVLKMTAWESVQETLKWIEEHLEEEIQIDQLAQSAHLSVFYYQRLFNRLVGKPVMEYVKMRRLANAAEYLSRNHIKILDAALQFGFKSHEVFSRAFKETYAMTPEEYRSAPRPLSHYLMPDLSMKYYLIDENVPLAADGIILEVRRSSLTSPRHFLGLTVQNPINDTPGIDYLGELWNTLHKQKGMIDDLIPDGNELGLSSPGEVDGCFTYFAGAEVKTDEEQSAFMKALIPSGEYVICSFEAENFYQLTTNALNKARDYMFGVWLPSHKTVIEPFMAELYFETAPDATSMEIWLKSKE